MNTVKITGAKHGSYNNYEIIGGIIGPDKHLFGQKFSSVVNSLFGDSLCIDYYTDRDPYYLMGLKPNDYFDYIYNKKNLYTLMNKDKTIEYGQLNIYKQSPSELFMNIKFDKDFLDSQFITTSYTYFKPTVRATIRFETDDHLYNMYKGSIIELVGYNNNPNINYTDDWVVRLTSKSSDGYTTNRNGIFPTLDVKETNSNGKYITTFTLSNYLGNVLKDSVSPYEYNFNLDVNSGKIVNLRFTLGN